MTDKRLYFTDNLTSWRRLIMLMRYYLPSMKKPLIWYPIVIFVLVILAGLASLGSAGSLSPTAYSSILGNPLGFMFYFAPMMLACRDYRFTSAQLPVTTGEKVGFLLLFTWVIVPSIFIGASAVGNLVTTLVMGQNIYAQYIAIIREFDIGDIVIYGFIMGYGLTTIVMYFIATSKGNRIVAGIVSYVVAIAVILVVSMIIGGIDGYYQRDAIVELAQSYNPEQIDEAPTFVLKSTVIRHIINSVLVPSTIIIGCGAIVLTALLPRKLRNRGF